MTDFYKDLEKKQQQLQDKAEFALDYAKKLGVSSCEISITSRKGLSVSSRDCDLENIEFNNDCGLSVTVYDNHRKSSSYTTDLQIDAVKQTVEKAKELTKYTNEDEFSGILEEEYVCKEFKDFNVLHEVESDADKLKERVIALEKEALERNVKGIHKSDGAYIENYISSGAMVCSNGFSHSNSCSNNNISISLIGKEGDKMQTGYGYSGNSDTNKLYSNDRIIDEAIDMVLGKLDQREIKTGKYPVIFHKKAAISLLSNIFAAISGTSIYRQSSFLLDSLNKLVLNKNLTIEEDPFIMNKLYSANCDDEGAQKHKCNIVEDGILTTYLLSSYSARKLKLKNTAHAGGPSNVKLIAREQCSFEELQKSVGTGIVVTSLMGQGIDIVSGNYSQGASGYYFENGERKHAVSEITIASNLKDMFLNIGAVANNYDERYRFQCPSYVIDNIAVSANN